MLKGKQMLSIIPQYFRIAGLHFRDNDLATAASPPPLLDLINEIVFSGVLLHP